MNKPIKIKVPPLKNEAEIKQLIYASLAEILKPLLDKWEHDIKTGSIDQIFGLEKAYADLKELIDKAHGRMN